MFLALGCWYVCGALFFFLFGAVFFVVFAVFFGSIFLWVVRPQKSAETTGSKGVGEKREKTAEKPAGRAIERKKVNC